MIELQRLNGDLIYVNPDLIRWVESKPDSIITFIDGKTLTVKDRPDEIRAKMIVFKKDQHSWDK